ncbi:MAG TPA: alanine--tRNA ligase [Acidimicrobiales bacterium]|jgi:alanyl-tRNA synthetase|nr:alanine--tRNA ligase [Acidimicrobiales bacterium]
MNAEELRRAWITFWQERDHTFVPSAGLIPHHPTAPMFTNSGMMQFVPYFLGEEPVPYRPPRASSVQKCVRLAGKHNDIDEVGRTRRHLTFFEMLGNWSFGDYFKRDAIAWAWDFVTNVTGFDGDRIWITVHDTDDEAEAIWHDDIGVPIERIQRMGKENYWEMGETGPCGVSSEIHFDSGAEWGEEGGPKFGGSDRYIEFWNLVFMTDFRHGDGHLTELPAKNIDTGAGFERWLMLLEGGRTAFDTDLFAPLLETAQSVTGKRLGADDDIDYALRILADHARTMTLLVNDGVVPSNEDRGYVLRRVIRRAVRFAYLLGVHSPVLPALVDTTIETMGDAYPELKTNESWVASILANEEASFRATLERGMTLLEESLASRPELVPGDVAFRLHDTHGFPVEVTQEIAAERGVDVDLDAFDRLMSEQRARAKQASRKDDVYANLTSFQEVLDQFGPTDFVGREDFETKATILAIVDDSVFLDRSPFYAESGGQVGDTGTITTDTGRAEVLDTTFALPGLHRHVVRIVDGELTPGQEATAAIDVPRRDAIRRNHTGTHILHWALRKVIGDHLKQQGSLVAPDRLRFDFGPAEALTAAQIRAIEDLANEEILGNDPVRHYETTKQNATEIGAIAFFGEKYGDIVRVLEAGRHSLELCGGTHVRALGDIGPIKIVKEESIGSNLRRIEAVTGTGPIERLRHDEAVLAELADVLNVSTGEVIDGARKRLDEIKALRDEIKGLRRQSAIAQSSSLAEQAIDGVVVARIDDVDRDTLRDLALAVRDRPSVRAVVLGGAPAGGGAALVSAARKDSGLDAAELIAEAAKTIKGGGGKDPSLAIAGGKDPSALDAALDQVRVAAGLVSA